MYNSVIEQVHTSFYHTYNTKKPVKATTCRISNCVTNSDISAFRFFFFKVRLFLVSRAQQIWRYISLVHQLIYINFCNSYSNDTSSSGSDILGGCKINRNYGLMWHENATLSHICLSVCIKHDTEQDRNTHIHINRGGMFQFNSNVFLWWRITT